ncbi:G1/S-specific cyclin CCN1 [Fusarium oxysporum f. sp. raphani]|uniref:G1/S-specific cyclin CCN1 n=1 Tax=Fusarium oxysporum f. sp. raphani TaxID=96318 RepID=A0A8J5UL70_FUSOX|nr:G1/S-specific cyclin CCN1 [Fusarium oxysporum f. sp. raphani]
MACSQQGDTYFGESDEPHHRIMAREAARMMARQRQDIIGVELSRLAGYEYLEDIMQHMREMEDETLPDVSLIDMQDDIQWFMRPYLIDFLIEAHAQRTDLIGQMATYGAPPQPTKLLDLVVGHPAHAAFGLPPETLFLTVNLLDRYCSKRVVYKQHYQLVGCAALLIAAKYCDKKDRVPQIHELNNMCCGLYDAEINNRGWDQTENVTLNTLAYYLHQTSPTLAHKYSTTSFSRVSQKLAEFMAEQAAIACRAANPAIPLAEPINKHTSNIFRAPQKGHSAMGFDGYSTPPIASDSNSLMGNHNMAKESYDLPPQCQVTPIPPNHAALYGQP